MCFSFNKNVGREEKEQSVRNRQCLKLAECLVSKRRRSRAVNTGLAQAYRAISQKTEMQLQNRVNVSMGRGEGGV